MSRRSSVPPRVDHRGLFLVLAAAVLGVLLSAAVLGRAAPEVYDRLFVGSGAAGAELHRRDARLEEDLARLEASGVSEVAIGERLQQHLAQSLDLRSSVLQARLKWQRRLDSWMLAAVLVMLVVMVLETAALPRPWLVRLAWVRYLLISLWLVLALARPGSLAGVSWPLVGMALAALAGLGLISEAWWRKRGAGSA